MLLKFAPEETIKVEDVGEDTKITYTPGQESYEIDKQASDALKAAQEDVEKKTQKLLI